MDGTEWEALAEESGQEETVVLRLSQVNGLRFQALAECLQNAVEARLFVDYVPDRSFYDYAYPELEKEQPGEKEEGSDEFWTNMEFMTDDACFQEGLARICGSVSSREERTFLFYRINLYWAEFSGKDITQYFSEVADFKWWYQWEEWCANLRELVVRRVGSSAGGARNVEGIHRAMNYIREHMDREISLEELLQLTGMSKSYFSKNFKQVTGKTFLAYLNDIRIDAAKKYLLETKQPVFWIAEQVGFVDEHYFRKIFKRNTGMSPRAFREKSDKGI